MKRKPLIGKGIREYISPEAVGPTGYTVTGSSQQGNATFSDESQNSQWETGPSGRRKH